MSTGLRHQHIDFELPWVPVSPEEKARLEEELNTEVCLLHNLAPTHCHAVARRIDSNHVLFEIGPHLCECAVIELTWSGKTEMDPQYPAFEIYATFDDWVQERMLPDRDAYLRN